MLPNSNAPPPLPPKPANVRGEKITDVPQRSRPQTTPRTSAQLSETEFVQISTLVPPPTRPLPPVPRSDKKPSYGDEGSWGPSILDDKSQLDPPQPPEPTIMSDGEPIKSSVGLMETSTPSLSDPSGNLPLLFPLPPYSVQDYKISFMFPPIPFTSELGEQSLSEKFIQLSMESAEDSDIGALVLSRDRNASQEVRPPMRPTPVHWNLYIGQEPGGEVWSVLHEYLTNASLKVRGRNRALQLLTGYVVGACLANTDAGIGLLSEIVRRMRGTERSERDGSIFTLLLNIAAHASFTERSLWGNVEEVARKVFSDVVEAMHGRQDDDVMWERALRCYLALLRSCGRWPSEQISSKCLAALALHVQYSVHPDIDHVLISEGLCPRLLVNGDDSVNPANVNSDCLSQIGGIRTILTLFVDTASPSARQSLFRVIYDYATLTSLRKFPLHTKEILKEHIMSFRALLEAHDIADCVVHTFRLGPLSDFAISTVRMMLFDPLCHSLQDLLVGKPEDASLNVKNMLQEKTESLSLSETRLSGSIGRAYRSAATKYIASVRAMVKLLDKPFCFMVLGQLQEMASEHARFLAERENMHYAREWRILFDLETQLRDFVYSGLSDVVASLTKALESMHAAVVEITSGRSPLRSVLQMCEIVIDFLTVKTPFTKRSAIISHTATSSVSGLFLKGQLIVSRDLLRYVEPQVFGLLLHATRTKQASKRLSESRQCLVEFLGSSRDSSLLLQSFVDDDDAAVAYRAAEILSKFTDIAQERNTSTSSVEKR